MSIRWTDNDTDFLFNNCGLMSNKYIAKKLNRSPHAIRQKLHKRGISVFTNFYSARLLAKALGKCHKTIMTWHKKGYLKGKRAEWGRGYLWPPMIFIEDDIVTFLKEYCHLVDQKEVNHPYFRNTLRENNEHIANTK